MGVGYDEERCWQYTYRKIAALLFAANRRRTRERREDLALQAMAARGDPKEVKRLLRDDEAGR